MGNSDGETGTGSESGVIDGLRLSGLPPQAPEVDSDTAVESIPTGLTEAERTPVRDVGEYSTATPLAEITAMREVSDAAATNPRVRWRARLVALAVLLPVLASIFLFVRSLFG